MDAVAGEEGRDPSGVGEQVVVALGRRAATGRGWRGARLDRQAGRQRFWSRHVAGIADQAGEPIENLVGACYRLPEAAYREVMERTYPHGVTSWIDLEVPDTEAAQRFYAGLLGWSFVEAMPPGAPGSYLIATMGGQDVAAIAPARGDDATAAWNTYVAVDDADATAAAVAAAGGTVAAPPEDVGSAGRTAICRDPFGAEFRLWQAGRRKGAQLTNAPGTWNFSDLHASDVAAALAFYAPLFGWQADDMQGPLMLRVPGYGDHLESTTDPDIRKRQEFAPPGFADVIGGIAPVAPGEIPHWHVTFTVEDREQAIATAEPLGATVVSLTETPWTRVAVLRDPHGAEFTVSQFTPPAP